VQLIECQCELSIAKCRSKPFTLITAAAAPVSLKGMNEFAGCSLTQSAGNVASACENHELCNRGARRRCELHNSENEFSPVPRSFGERLTSDLLTHSSERFDQKIFAAALLFVL
jgi:hypothetical protein